MNTCIRCNEAPTNSALCVECKAEVRANITAETAPILAARRAERAAERERGLRAWNHARAMGA